MLGIGSGGAVMERNTRQNGPWTPDEQSVLDKAVVKLRESLLKRRVAGFYGSVAVRIEIGDGRLKDFRMITTEIDT